ncbi:MAG: FG-GAP-like repeat-containing protein [Candidatus Omnitrophota bacterium]
MNISSYFRLVGLRIMLFFVLLGVVLIPTDCFAQEVNEPQADSPYIEITSPKNNSTTDLDVLGVDVYFHGKVLETTSSEPLYGGNVKIITLVLNGETIGIEYNPASIKESTKHFGANLSGLAEGSYVLQSFAYQGSLNSGIIGKSAPITFIIDRNKPPVANAGLNITAHVGSEVDLDASASFDPDGDVLSYQWNVIFFPIGSQPELTAAVETAVFISDAIGEYEIQVTVTDPRGAEDSTSIIITTTNNAPEAIATSNEAKIFVNASIALDASLSSDPDADILTYNWTLSAPQDSLAELIDANSSIATLIPDITGTYTAQVTVSDPWGASDTVTVSITAIPDTRPFTTPESGFITGMVVDAYTESSLSDVKVSIRGVSGFISTDGDGEFSFPTPDSGTYLLTFEKNGYVYSQRTIKVVSTRDAFVDTVYLKQFDSAVTTITNAGGTHHSADGTIQLTIPANALPGDVSTIDVKTTKYVKGRELPSALPRSSMFTYAIDFQPDGINFKENVSGRFLNELGFLPGTQIPIGYYNKNTGKWEDTALKGIVSSDGQWVNFSLHHFSPYDINLSAYLRPKYSSPSVQAEISLNKINSKNCAKDKGNSIVYLKSGELVQENVLPAYTVLDQKYAPALIYNSLGARPSQLFDVKTRLDSTISIIPETTDFKLKVEGIEDSIHFRGVSGNTNYRYLFDAVNARGQTLSTGSYPYKLEVTNNYEGLTYGTTSFFGGPATGDTGVLTREPVPMTTIQSGRFSINNLSSSPFGSGWSLSVLQRLHQEPDGALLLTEGDGSALSFSYNKHLHQAQLKQHFAVIANDNSSIYVFSNTGDGNFNNPKRYIVGTSPFWLTSADYDRDGFTDLAVGDYVDRQVRVLKGNGNGTFNDPVAYPVPYVPFNINSADFNQDGYVDIIAAANGAYLQLMFNNGDGTFQTPVSISVGETPGKPIIGDFNQDHIPDVAFTTSISNIWYGVYIFINNGEGSFRFNGSYEADRRLNNMVAGDFNSDGVTDLAVTDSYLHKVYIFINNGDGTMKAPVSLSSANPTGIVAGDFNQDQIIDLAVTNINADTISMLLNYGDATFSPYTFSTGDRPLKIFATDFDSDEIADLLITTNTMWGVSLTIGDGDGTFEDWYNLPFYTWGGTTSSIRDITPLNFIADTEVEYYAPENSYLASGGDYTYIVKNDDDSFTRFYKNGVRIEFNAQGIQTAIIDKNGNTTTYEYEDRDVDGEVDELIRVILPNGAQYQYVYDGSGKLLSVTDPAQRATNFVINSNGDLMQVIYEDGSSVSYEYDDNHLMTKKIDKRGNTTDYEYDEYGTITQIRSPERLITDVDANGFITSSRKRETRNYIASDVKGLTNDLGLGLGTYNNPAEPVNPELMTETFVDAKANIWTYQTNKLGGRLKFVDPLGNVEQYARNANSELLKLTRANGSITRFNYDCRGNVRLVKEEYSGAESKVIYESEFSQPVEIKDALNNLTNIDYDENGNPVIITDANGTMMVMEYNIRGQITKATSAYGLPEQNQIIFEYDPETFNLKKVTDSLNRITSYTYDDAGNVVSIIDPKLKTTVYAYDSMNRVQTVKDADNNITSFDYDAAGNLIAVNTPNNQTTQYVYDEQGQLVKTINALSEETFYSYDSNRNLSVVTTPIGDEIKLYYNAANLLKDKFLPDDTVTYAYDAVYNLIAVSDNDSSLEFDYDPISRLTKGYALAGFNQPQTAISYAYDLNNNRTLMVEPNSIKKNYVYDSLNRLTEIRNTSDTLLASFDYDPLSRRTKKTLDPGVNQIEAGYAYDNASQLLSLAYNPLSLAYNPLSLAYDYTYDNAGNRDSMTDDYGLHSYQYDNLYRLTQAIHPNISIEQFVYDALGNRNSVQYSYNDANQLLEDGLFTYNYDNNGNMIAKIRKGSGEQTTYTYDSEDQLININSPGMSVSYRYDALGRRIEKNVNGQITKYVYDGEDIIAEYDVNNNIIARYTHGPAIDEPLILDKNGQTYYYQTDGLGSVTNITDVNNQTVKTYQYDSFGNIKSTTGSLNQPFTYTGREYDSESGLYYYRARYYDPSIGRFLQEDPVWDTNLYAYVGNNPVNYVDPDGLQSLNVFFIDIAGLGRLQALNVLFVDIAGLGPIFGAQNIPGLREGLSEICFNTESIGSDGKLLSNKGKEEIKERKRPGRNNEIIRIRKIKDIWGKTKEVWHEVLDRKGNLIHRDWKGPGANPYIK